MRRKFLTLALVGVTLVLASLTRPVSATDLVERIGERLARHPVLRANFTQTKRVAALKRPLVMTGTFVFSRHDGVLLNIEQPYRIGYALGPDHVTEFGADGNTRRRSVRDAPAAAEASRIFRALFAADLPVLRQTFDISAGGDLASWQIELRPRRSEIAQRLKSVKFSGSDFVRTIVIEESGGDVTDIRLQHMKADGALTAGELAMFGTLR
jgi:hypothetical protein